MASLRGLAYYALGHQLMGRALIVNVGNARRCMVAEMAPNILARAAGEGNVPQIRFICDGYCGVPARRPSKACRSVDRPSAQNAAAYANVPAPPGLIGTADNVSVNTPYTSGGGGRPGAFAGAPAAGVPGGILVP